MSRMNIPLKKDEIMEILQLGSLPRDWRRNGATISTWHGAYTFENGFCLSMFADGLKRLMEIRPNATRDSLFFGLFMVLAEGLPDLFEKVS